MPDPKLQGNAQIAMLIYPGFTALGFAGGTLESARPDIVRLLDADLHSFVDEANSLRVQPA
ncbi:MAG TPA: hypothetical protein VEZ16_10675 [Microvirga sp.]|nr:hypothetical protein [Microvirga sp.]